MVDVKDYPKWILKKGKWITCACGCGPMFSYNKKGRLRTMYAGHDILIPGGRVDEFRKRAHAAQQAKAGTGELFHADGKHWRTCRWRARTLIKPTACTWELIGGCKGPLQVAHVDQDFTNNDLSNLLSLCVSHHRLLDNGKINPKNPVMPSFYTDGSGKRRYKKRRK